MTSLTDKSSLTDNSSFNQWLLDRQIDSELIPSIKHKLGVLNPQAFTDLVDGDINNFVSSYIHTTVQKRRFIRSYREIKYGESPSPPKSRSKSGETKVSPNNDPNQINNNNNTCNNNNKPVTTMMIEEVDSGNNSNGTPDYCGDNDQRRDSHGVSFSYCYIIYYYIFIYLSTLTTDNLFSYLIGTGNVSCVMYNFL